ncbi:hypothetical protein M1105_10130 [Limibaculum sp. FT325]|uniref:hypothetical protein n=1 Tax=Thermohalobaculum sediminis TaxID=2939436 RepID=UPI0020C057CE|nr:hypothetical protein [Limibaculum sediminis]MCL5777344.1 hypothetical protein [Limibaculum sediminis]
MRRTAPALMLALAACAPSRPPEAYGYRQPDAPAEPFRAVVLEADYAAVRTGLEQVGAVCWLDAELQAANMLVDRQTGDVSFFTDAGKLMTADIVPVRANVTEVRLIGAAVEAPGRYERMKSSLTRSVAAGAAAC